VIAERHNGPLSNVHANQPGNAGNCKSGAPSSLPWRRLVFGGGLVSAQRKKFYDEPK
jgi:hypothetical protein